MKFSSRSWIRHSAFTLIELLVVIAIIAVLIALLMPAVMRVLSKGPQIITTNELAQLDTAIQKFKTEYNMDYIPSKIKLCEKFSDYDLTQKLDNDSTNYL